MSKARVPAPAPAPTTPLTPPEPETIHFDS
jgi:hypothetical protein